MPLLPRLIGLTEPKIAVHTFMAGLGEWQRGLATRNDVITAFAIQASEEADLDAMVAKVVPPLESVSFGGFATLTNVGNTYDATNPATGLGFAQVEYAGISGYEFRVGMNRNVAGGTISWQLWNDTDGVEVARIDDVSGAGNKFVSTGPQSVGPLAAGIKTLRVRCKSTTGNDDPIYYGASLLIRRVGIMTADVLHQVLLLAEDGVAYATDSALRARLGMA